MNGSQVYTRTIIRKVRIIAGNTVAKVAGLGSQLKFSFQTVPV